MWLCARSLDHSMEDEEGKETEFGCPAKSLSDSAHFRKGITLSKVECSSASTGIMRSGFDEKWELRECKGGIKIQQERERRCKKSIKLSRGSLLLP